MKTAVPLLPWQKAYVADDARRKLLVKSVQVGGSFAASLEPVIEILAKPELWIILSASERQSKEVVEEKVAAHIHAAQIAAKIETGFFEETSITQHLIKFPNGGRIIALPANPDTARGYSGNVILDEFAIHRDARAIWKAMVGRTMRGYKLRVLSSFKGRQNKFFELAKELGLIATHRGWEPETNPTRQGVWSGHFISLPMAIRQGLPIDLQELLDAIGDPEIADEEFFCIPVEGAQDFIPLELVLACESPDASIDATLPDGAEIYAGFDIARKRDLSVLWVLERDPSGLLTRNVIWMPRTRFADQRDIVRPIAARATRLSIDATGMGAQLAEELASEFPGIVEAVQFTGPVKDVLAAQLKIALEERTVRIPEDNRIRRAIQAVKRYTGPTGQVRLDAARSDAGHADEFWAFALALSAAATKPYHPLSDGALLGQTILGNLLEARL